MLSDSSAFDPPFISPIPPLLLLVAAAHIPLVPSIGTALPSHLADRITVAVIPMESLPQLE